MEERLDELVIWVSGAGQDVKVTINSVQVLTHTGLPASRRSGIMPQWKR